jgi:pimeloyl-ACP methyl ester carboxylesterase
MWIMIPITSAIQVLGRICSRGTLLRPGGELGGDRGMASYQQAETCEYTIDADAATLEGLIQRITDRAPGSKVVLVGHSQGGLIASYLVGRLHAMDPAFLSRIASVVTLDSFPHGLPALDVAFARQVPPFNICQGIPDQMTSFGGWGDSSVIGQTAAQAAGVVPFYTLAADSLLDPTAPENTFSIGGSLIGGDGLTGFQDTDAKHVHIGGTSHVSIWENRPAPGSDWQRIYGPSSPLALLVAQPARLQAQQMLACAVQDIKGDACVISPMPFSVAIVAQIGQADIDINTLLNRAHLGVLSFGGGVLQQPTVVITQETIALSRPAGSPISTGVSFTLQLVSEATGDLIGTLSDPLPAPYQQILNYDPAPLPNLGVTRPQNQVGLYFLDTASNQWLKVPGTIVVDSIAQHDYSQSHTCYRIRATGRRCAAGDDGNGDRHSCS